MPRTRRSDPSSPGYGRVGRGKGFSYCDEGGDTITDEAQLERIKALVIPPAWKDVWICADERGHIQAVGTDDAGRRQYLYHDDFRAQRDREKFKRLPEFAKRLGPAREALEKDLALRGLTRERVMACAVRLLDIGLFRVGGEDYAEENDSYGLATLQKQHVRVRKNEIEFDYVAKGGLERTYTIEDRLVVPTVTSLKRRRGKPTDELLAYRESRGVWSDVSSAEINQWVKDLLGPEHTAKDFRTWNGTVLAAMRLAARADEDDRDRSRRRGREGGRRDAGQHARGRPFLLHRPSSDLEVRARDDDQGGDGPPRRKGLLEGLRRPRGHRKSSDQADHLVAV